MAADLLADLRTALFAHLDLADVGVTNESLGRVWRPSLARLANAVNAITTSDSPPTADAIDALADEFRVEAERRHRLKFLTPLYPWGVIHIVSGTANDLRYRTLLAGHTGPCTCALVREHELYDHLATKDFIQTSASEDFYDRYEDYRCPHCGAEWRHQDSSTEQYTAWHWIPKPAE